MTETTPKTEITSPTETPSETETTHLRATDIEHSYGPVTVLDGVSLTLERGTITALIGPNGAGKSTLIRALTGLQPPTGGTVSYTGPEAVRPVGYLPQQPAFRPGQSVLQALTYYCWLVGEGEAAANDALKQVGLAVATDRDVSELSGGMTRLLGIAQATVGDPPVIILDEPASGLDPEMSLHVFETLERLSDDGTAILLSSHDLALVEETAETVALLDGGQFVATGSPDELREQTGTESLLAAFKSAIDREKGTLRVQEATYDY